MPIVIYGIDGSNNKYETLTKEQILDAIADAQLGHSVFNYNAAVISQIKEQNHGYPMKFWIGTQAEYNAIQTPETNVLYLISDDTSKEEIIAAIENLAETVDGVELALGNKQDTLTFDTAPTQNSTNPATSGGIYTAINNAKVKRTVLWTREIGSAELMSIDDSVTLSESVANFDFLEICIQRGNTSDPNVFDTKYYKVVNGGKIEVHWTAAESVGSNVCDVTHNDAILRLNNNTVTITNAAYISTEFSRGGSVIPSSVVGSTVQAHIYQFIGVKL